jgi:hypothetical protein
MGRSQENASCLGFILGFIIAEHQLLRNLQEGWRDAEKYMSAPGRNARGCNHCKGTA